MLVGHRPYLYKVHNSHVTRYSTLPRKPDVIVDPANLRLSLSLSSTRWVTVPKISSTLAVGWRCRRFAEYVPVVAAAVAQGSRRVYGNYWSRVVERWGDRRLDQVTPTEVETLMRQLQDNAPPW
ncbi:hypothetical protein [Actinoplanes sp. NPDC026623]|uniref:hypothetical protein n=1 Tax=Actinoplanes sp. NPDC026623 TaxID=3155610 RepID=UPI0034055E88